MTLPIDPADRPPLPPDEHRAWVEAQFRRLHPGLADGAWAYGLITLHALNDNGHGQVATPSLHRARCPIVAQIAAITGEGSPFPIWPVHSPHDVGPARGRCATCGTDTLPDGAIEWGDHERDVAFREALDRLTRRIQAYRNARARAHADARQQAEHEILTEHATEIELRAEVYRQRLLADLAAQFPDVLVHLLATGDPDITT